jgi:hypothetical protein
MNEVSVASSRLRGWRMQREVPDVERVMDETTAHPERGVPYALFLKRQ